MRLPERRTGNAVALAAMVGWVLGPGAGAPAGTPQAGDERPAAPLFAAARAPAPGPAAVVGGHSRGCLLGAVAVPERGPGWRLSHPERGRSWAHPATAAFIARLAARARQAGLSGLVIGDIAQPWGGPMTRGHRSHQTGLDVDIWLHLPAPGEMATAPPPGWSSPDLVRPDARGVNRRWRREHATLLRLAAEDEAVARVFVNAAIKRALCEETPPGAEARAWLAKVRPWWGHRAHMHVRLRCPPGDSACVDQPPPPPGDGCGAELAWWFTEEARRPAPPAAPPAALRLADLPPACRAAAAP